MSLNLMSPILIMCQILWPCCDVVKIPVVGVSLVVVSSDVGSSVTVSSVEELSFEVLNSQRACNENSGYSSFWKDSFRQSRSDHVFVQVGLGPILSRAQFLL